MRCVVMLVCADGHKSRLRRATPICRCFLFFPDTFCVIICCGGLRNDNVFMASICLSFGCGLFKTVTVQSRKRKEIAKTAISFSIAPYCCAA